MSNKKDSYWFRHDSTAGRALKMRKMAHKFGHWGKGIYWDVIEILRDQNEYKYESNDDSLKLLADLIGCKDVNKFILWFKECIKVELFKNQEDGCFYSEILSKNMMKWEAKKNNGSQPKNKRNGSETEATTKDKIIEHNTEDKSTEHNTVDDIKKEEIIENEIFFLKINGNIFKEKVSVYFMKNHSIFFESWKMQKGSGRPAADVEQEMNKVFDKMDIEYNGYEFTNDNHVQNAFKTVYKNLILSKNGKSTESGSTAVITAGKKWKS